MNRLILLVLVSVFLAGRAQAQTLPQFIRGDANYDWSLDGSDVTVITQWLCCGGDEPYPLPSGDVNDDGYINYTDATVLAEYLWQSGSPPPPPVYWGLDPSYKAPGGGGEGECFHWPVDWLDGPSEQYPVTTDSDYWPIGGYSGFSSHTADSNNHDRTATYKWNVLQQCTQHPADERFREKGTFLFSYDEKPQAFWTGKVAAARSKCDITAKFKVKVIIDGDQLCGCSTPSPTDIEENRWELTGMASVDFIFETFYGQQMVITDQQLDFSKTGSSSWYTQQSGDCIMMNKFGVGDNGCPCDPYGLGIKWFQYNSECGVAAQIDSCHFNGSINLNAENPCPGEPWWCRDIPMHFEWTFYVLGKLSATDLDNATSDTECIPRTLSQVSLEDIVVYFVGASTDDDRLFEVNTLELQVTLEEVKIDTNMS